MCIFFKNFSSFSFFIFFLFLYLVIRFLRQKKNNIRDGRIFSLSTSTQIFKINELLKF